MKLVIGIVLAWGALNWNADARAFRFISPADGAVVAAGSTLRIEVDPEGVDGLIAVLFTASLGILKERLDAFPPWSWTLQIPANYLGPVTFSATGRVLGQKIGWAPHAEVTVNVTVPTQLTAP